MHGGMFRLAMTKQMKRKAAKKTDLLSTFTNKYLTFRNKLFNRGNSNSTN